jgi:hypothetical protein
MISYGINLIKVVLSLSNRLKVNNISFDVIINSSVKANTNSQWIDSANGNLRLIFDLIKKNQIGVVFQSWNKYPDKIIPEWSPNSSESSCFFEKLMQLNSNGTQMKQFIYFPLNVILIMSIGLFLTFFPFSYYYVTPDTLDVFFYIISLLPYVFFYFFSKKYYKLDFPESKNITLHSIYKIFLSLVSSVS